MISAATAPASPFDALAPAYDADFSRGLVGRLLRRAVWRRARAAVRPGDRVLDVGCGTGEDALRMARAGARVIAVDASPGMVERARERVATEPLPTGAGGSVDVRLLDVRAVAELAPDGPFDVVLSNFGVLNCVPDLPHVGRALVRCTRPGSRVLLCVMGPLVPWEWAWFLARGKVVKAFRRLHPGGVVWRGLRVRYPGPGTLAAALGPGFRRTRVSAVGALVPPSYAEGWARRHPRLVRRLARWERRLEAVWPLPWLSDHYLLELVRVEEP